MVSDAQASARWWKEKLGFVVHTIGSGDHAILVAPPGDRFVLHLCQGFGVVEPGNSGIAFVTDDVEAMVRRMEAAGVSFPEPLKQESWGGLAKFADPDGNVFWLMGAPAAFIRRETYARASLPGRPKKGKGVRKGLPALSRSRR